MHFLSGKKLFLSLTLFACTTAAWAQYVWLDERGAKQFSDQPPPASVPKSKILKQPSNAVTTAAPVDSATPAASDNAAPKAPMSLAERNADYVKRRADQAEKDKKAAEDEQNARNKAKNCDNARQYQSALNSGQRISSTDKNGERVFMSDEQRKRELQESRRILNDCK